jgi:gastric triacylglycerol lipase
MPGDTWITTDVGRVFCSTFAGVCGDLIGSMISADPKLDNYDRYDVLAGHDPGKLIL